MDKSFQIFGKFFCSKCMDLYEPVKVSGLKQWYWIVSWDNEMVWILATFSNSRTAIAGAIIGLLLVFFYFVVMIFVTTIWRHSHFLFIRSCYFNWISCVTSFFALSGASFFCSCAWLNFWSHLTYLTLKNDFLNLKLTYIYFNSKR